MAIDPKSRPEPQIWRAIRRLPSVETQLAAWIEAVEQGVIHTTADLTAAKFRIYVHRGVRYVEGRNRTFLVIANVFVPERLQRRGWFGTFRKLAERLQPWEGTYYESVLNEGLNAHLRRAGLASDGGDGYYVLNQGLQTRLHHVRPSAV